MMKVRFLSHTEAVREFATSTYLKSHSPDEAKLKLLRYCNGYSPDIPLYDQLLRCYTSKIIPFSSEEKAILKYYFKLLFARLNRKAPLLLPNKQTVGLIQIDYGVDWNAPFTINHSIVISEMTMSSMKKAYIYFRQTGRCKKVKRNLATLCHEFAHIIQRYPKLYPKQHQIFDHAYKHWGFVPITKPLDWSQVDMKKFFSLRTNPDGAQFQWMYPLRGKMYMPIFGEVGGDEKYMGRLDGALVQVLPEKDRIVVTNNLDYTKNFNEYINRFYGRDEQIYHPQEIMAVYLCNAMV